MINRELSQYSLIVTTDQLKTVGIVTSDPGNIGYNEIYDMKKKFGISFSYRTGIIGAGNYKYFFDTEESMVKFMMLI